MIPFDAAIFPPTARTDFWTISKRVQRHGLVDTPYVFCDDMYLVTRGAIKVCFADEDKEIILAFATSGELVCNFISFLSGAPSQIYLQAIKQTELIGFTREQFDTLLATDPQFGYTYRKALESKIVEILNRHLIQYTSNPQKRVELLLKQKPDIFQHIPKRYIAYYLGLAPETLSRLPKP
ncbi:MAG: Crp/Fnr family transcriptional regulator [Bacteroidia bacterium]|nr:Crp/Fnr family transcriptional regulator [Bacteroidia bacterium]